MKRTLIVVLLISTLLFACSSPPPTISADIVQTAIAQTQAADPTSTLSSSPTARPADSLIPQATPEFRPVRLNVATIIANLKPLFSIAKREIPITIAIILANAPLTKGDLIKREIPISIKKTGQYFQILTQ